MQTLKKKDIKNFKSSKSKKKVEVEEDVEVIDELVDATGGPISGGDEKNVNNSEIETAPQATSDEFNQHAIQPNRYLYNVNSVGARVNGVKNDSVAAKAKGKLINLLESLDANNNQILDINELPMSVRNKVNELTSTIDKNGLNDEQASMMMNYIDAHIRNKK